MRSLNKEELHSTFVEMAKNREIGFNKLYSKYNKLVYAIAFSILKNKEDSEEVAQSTLMKIWKLEKNKLPTTYEASWLYSVVKNETLNYLRNKKIEFNIDDIYYASSENSEIEEIIEQDKYNRMISKLNLQEQEIVSLKVLSNFSFKEISQMLNMPIGTVQWKYYKSLNSLKLLLTNFSLFIITLGILVANKNNKKSKNILEQQNTSKDEESETKDEHEWNISQDSTTEQSMQNQEDKLNNQIENKAESTTVQDKSNEQKENTIIQEETITENVVVESNMFTTPTKLDIGILVLSAIFLVLSLICLINVINHYRRSKSEIDNNK